jgi:hypothetical protein
VLLDNNNIPMKIKYVKEFQLPHGIPAVKIFPLIITGSKNYNPTPCGRSLAPSWRDVYGETSVRGGKDAESGPLDSADTDFPLLIVHGWNTIDLGTSCADGFSFATS